MASPILTNKHISQLSSSPIRKPTVATLSNSVSFSSIRAHHLPLIPLSQWSGLRQLSISISHNYVKFEKRRKCRGKGVYASLFGVGAPEALVIGVVALLVFGPKGLAEVARNLGKTLREFQPTIRELQDVSREFKSTLEREIGLDEIQNPIQKNYSSSTTNTNSIPSAIETNTNSIPSAIDSPENSQIKAETTIDSPENSQIKAETIADGSLPVEKSSSDEIYLKVTDDQLQSVSTQQEKQTESVEEIQSEPRTSSQVEEPAAVVPPPQGTNSET
ncbi:Bacterial sec-independent translocation protein mttA/Hcf106 [Heracleum sosnowskyi]|uniref:Bacterial sec-independent translocation protein mttA/Hcf106 n=1 Tax=Heracleum sosnowskyi TaxID=360622 RepID=A0AAD8J7W6_9APIA|nr:Bacterial sec-independent translocation protein mttA/Hcf106 [Heracleum sosnowskyi]